MSAITVQNLGRRVSQRREPSGTLIHPWSAAWLAERLLNLQHEVLRRLPTSDERAVVEKIIALAQQPDLLTALRKRKDAQEAVRDLVIRYAFQLMLAEGWDSADLDALSRAMIQRTLDVIYKRAAQVARKVGEDPLSAEPELLLRLCESLARHTLHQPVGAHIQWKLEHYESAVSRAMRQVKHLVTRSEITEAFVAFVLAADTPKATGVLNAQLLHLARCKLINTTIGGDVAYMTRIESHLIRQGMNDMYPHLAANKEQLSVKRWIDYYSRYSD